VPLEPSYNCKDFITKLHRSSSIDYNHILLYKSIQPFPLRNDLEKLKVRDASNIQDPPNANQLEIMKLDKIREFLQKQLF